jgi:hypothetical protein
MTWDIKYELGLETQKGFIMCYNETHMNLDKMKQILREKRKWHGENWKIRKTARITETYISYVEG